MFSSLALYGKRTINASDSQSAHRKGIGLEWKLEELELRAPSGDKDRHRPLVIS